MKFGKFENLIKVIQIQKFYFKNQSKKFDIQKSYISIGIKFEKFENSIKFIQIQKFYLSNVF